MLAKLTVLNCGPSWEKIDQSTILFQTHDVLTSFPTPDMIRTLLRRRRRRLDKTLSTISNAVSLKKSL